MKKRWWIWLFASMILASCQTPENITAPPSSATNAADSALIERDDAERAAAEQLAHEQELAHKKRARIEAFVEKNADSFVAYAMKTVPPTEGGNKIRVFLDQPKADKAFSCKDCGDIKLPGARHLQQLRDAYAENGDAPFFVNAGKLSPRARIAADTFKALEDRGITPKMLDTTALNELLSRLEQSVEPDEVFVLNADERKLIADEIEKRDVDIADSSAIKVLIDDLVRSDGDRGLPRLNESISHHTRASRNSSIEAIADILFSDAVMTYGRIVKFNNRTHLTSEETQSLGKNPNEKKYAEIAENRMLPWFGQLSRSATAEEFESLWNGLYPSHPAYALLVEARKKYARLPDWGRVDTGKVTPRKASPVVGKLKLRLATEGLYRGDVSEEAQADPDFNVYSNNIRAAVQLYHETHQLDYDENKGLLKDFWISLNTPREQRMRQIDENLRRWYSTQLVDSNFYIYVNVPDFHGEVWKDGKLVHRFPVVAGSARRSCDPATKRWIYINATPLMHARMLYVEYNPYWNVPPRIEQEDYIEKINADPTWLETHGFEYYTENGRTILRQLPGDNNALGRVKFIFPNDHSTFLHDSPQKRFFKYPVRAFSHGCMRVWEPLKLAEILLKYDGQWYDGIATEIEDFQTRRILFKNRFDVFIDYFTVRASDDGLVYFLADPYHYVKDALDPPSPKSLECKPNPKAWIPRTSLQQGDDVGTDAAE